MIYSHIKAILFDKDGTIIDFMHTWYPLFSRFVQGLAQRAELQPQEARALAHDLGDRDDDLSPDSVFAHGSFQDILQIIQNHAPGFKYEDMVQAFQDGFSGHEIDAKPIGQVRQTLETLKQRGYLIGLATADDDANTRHTLGRANLLDLFEFLGTHNSVKQGKPHRELMDLFCQTYGLEPAQVAMVGDTRRDMEFGRNSGAGQCIFVRTSFPDTNAEALAHTVLDTVNHILGDIGDAENTGDE